MRRNSGKHRRRRGDGMKNRPLPSSGPRRYRRPSPAANQESEDYLIPLEEPLTAFADYSYPYQHQLTASFRGSPSPPPLQAWRGLPCSSPRRTMAVSATDIVQQPTGTPVLLESVENSSTAQLQLQRPLLPLPSGFDARTHALRPTLQATRSPGPTPLYEEIYEGPSEPYSTTKLWVKWLAEIRVS